MRHIDYGISILTAGVFAAFPDNVPFDLADVYLRLISEGEMAAFEVKQRFYEIGSPNGLAELDKLLRNNAVPVAT
jgi:NDP-sugar pyrophosphorylase family protein